MKTTLLLFAFFLAAPGLYAQPYIERDIRSFGAKGDGQSNDHEAFVRAAAFFNQRGGRGKLIISPGTYIVGKQTVTPNSSGEPCYRSEDVLHFTGVRQFTLEGTGGARLRFRDSLRFGAFDPTTGAPYHHGDNYFVDGAYAAFIGHCIYFENSEGVKISSLEIDGNNGAVVLGGVYGDVGRQLPHYGIFIANSKSVQAENVNVHHFALDGLCVANSASTTKDDITLLHCSFEYNSRQGLSWIGGNGLTARDCSFSHTGQGRFNSAPSAGVDIEAEWGPIRGGWFMDCRFINNKACGLVADSGDSGNCLFTNCTFWGTDSWSAWVTKPAFTFERCNFYGSFVHGYNAPTDEEATRFIECHFEDKPYEGRAAFGNFLVESNAVRRMNFLSCTFVSHRQKLMWLELGQSDPREKYQFNNCTFTIHNTNLPAGDFIGVFRGMRLKNCRFNFSRQARAMGYYLNTCCDDFNVDAGGNKETTTD